jgi:hypothetical protein
MAFFLNEARSGGDMMCDRRRVAVTGDAMIAMSDQMKNNNNGGWGIRRDERGPH